MRVGKCLVTLAAAVLPGGICPAVAASVPDSAGVPAQMVLTIRPAKPDSRPQGLVARDLTVTEGRVRAPVVRLERMAGEMANMQLFILLDDSTRSASLGTHIPELKRFIEALPATTQVAEGYMRNGTFRLTQAFTADHQKAAAALRLPLGEAGENGSPYFALSDLIDHWPSKEVTGRKAVLMLTDGVDRYYGGPEVDDPYVDSAIHKSLKSDVLVYSIYLRGAGIYGGGAWVKNFAQSRLMQVSQETGGFAYFETFSDPVAIAPFLKDFQDRMDNQYRVTIQAAARDKGSQPVKVQTESTGLKIEGPTRIYVP